MKRTICQYYLFILMTFNKKKTTNMSEQTRLYGMHFNNVIFFFFFDLLKYHSQSYLMFISPQDPTFRSCWHFDIGCIPT